MISIFSKPVKLQAADQDEVVKVALSIAKVVPGESGNYI